MVLQFQNTRTGDIYSKEDMNEWIKQTGEEKLIWQLYAEHIEKFDRTRREYSKKLRSVEAEGRAIGGDQGPLLADDLRWLDDIKNLADVVDSFDPTDYSKKPDPQKEEYQDDYAERVAEALDKVCLDPAANEEERGLNSSLAYVRICISMRE